MLINELDAVATRTSLDLVARSTPADFGKATPCEAWTLYGLVAHMTTQNLGFAASARGDGDLAHWKLVSLGDDPVATYRDSVERVLDAFAAIDRDELPLPEFSTEITFRPEQVLGFHFVDYVVHSWDVARTLGLPVHFDQDVLDAALRITESVPGGQSRLVPGAAFGPAVDGTELSGLDRVVALLGRSPKWPERLESVA
ncbi:TIGR03086 family metal-binding protein [Amycolatopsis sp., V23-08]|uniref:TIGR03086 family metal-binding protein n=1 Tax=Amycolatopsis heterodermiae TaxID=3110235 RepID=A0ABU5QZT7_9PSEU|nr:TIGR03086 family metal-binding protein [Amycolatopsis sp., V23-08]MEA5359443.1 TIGR03086 family metal-binding protein [Amycolatopsis sp., V23-08]